MAGESCICLRSRNRGRDEPGPQHHERCPLYEAPAEDVCPDCLDPACDGWCADALANEYGVEIDDLRR